MLVSAAAVCNEYNRPCHTTLARLYPCGPGLSDKILSNLKHSFDSVQNSQTWDSSKAANNNIAFPF